MENKQKCTVPLPEACPNNPTSQWQIDITFVSYVGTLPNVMYCLVSHFDSGMYPNFFQSSIHLVRNTICEYNYYVESKTIL